MVKVGDSCTVSGRFGGRPVPAVSWTKDGEELKAEEQIGLHSTAHHLSLSISKAQREHSGCYGVKVENAAGARSGLCTITVVGKAPLKPCRATLQQPEEPLKVALSSPQTAPSRHRVPWFLMRSTGTLWSSPGTPLWMTAVVLSPTTSLRRETPTETCGCLSPPPAPGPPARWAPEGPGSETPSGPGMHPFSSCCFLPAGAEAD